MSGALEARLRARLRRSRVALDAWYLAHELWWMVRDSTERSRAEFEREFVTVDPWAYGSAREQDRLCHATGLLDRAREGRPLGRALEVGCGEGWFTELLEPRVDTLLAVDFAPTALGRAVSRRAWGDPVAFQLWDLRQEPIPGRFDLVVAMDVLEAFSRPGDIRRARSKLIAATRPGGLLLIGNSRQRPEFETTWWGRRLVRGGVWIDRYFADHPSLGRIEGETRSFYVNCLFRRLA